MTQVTSHHITPKHSLKQSVYCACGPERLRASRTCYRPELPLVKTQVVPLRTFCVVNHTDPLTKRLAKRIYLQALSLVTVRVSLVIEINQRNQSTHFPAAMHYKSKFSTESRKSCSLSFLTDVRF